MTTALYKGKTIRKTTAGYEVLGTFYRSLDKATAAVDGMVG